MLSCHEMKFAKVLMLYLAPETLRWRIVSTVSLLAYIADEIICLQKTLISISVIMVDSTLMEYGSLMFP